MTSINYNVAANTTLRTLQQTNSALEMSQNRVSTGLKIGEAKDNAAYWSISTTLKSDNKALSTVSDALGLGAATVDTAYQGLNKAREVLDQIKTKLVAASQDGVDKAAVQGEITELQNQLKAIATSSSFSGENWLSSNSGATGYTAIKDVVSSFNRSSTGSVSLDTIKIDTTSFMLIDGDTGAEGILDAGKIGNASVNGLDTWTGSSNTPAAAASVSVPVGSFVAANGTLVGKVVVSGTDYNFSVATTGASTVDTVRTAILSSAVNSARQALSSVAVGGAAGTIAFSTNASGSAQTLSVVISTGASGIAAGTTAGTAGVDQSRSTTSLAVATTITLDKNDTVSLSLTVDGTAKKFTVTRGSVDAALGTAANGAIANAQQYALVINKALEQSNITGVVATGSGTANTDTVTLTVKGATTLVADTATASMGSSILGFSIIGANRATISSFIDAVSTATNSVTSAAATLGAVSARIELQNTFVNTLVDTIDKGVSGLIDADLSEESTKLQALQTKQQLGIQALSIANSSTQNILSLFRS